MDYVSETFKDKVLDTVYIGGGTPTTLEAEQMDRLLSHLEANFSFEDLKEITVEAGRPDSITRKKLEVLKAHKIGRISINPQTMQQKTLHEIGRWHTVEDIKEVFALARQIPTDCRVNAQQTKLGKVGGFAHQHVQRYPAC